MLQINCHKTKEHFMKKFFILRLPIFFILILSISATFLFFTKPKSNHGCGNNIIAGGNAQIGGRFTLTDVNHQKIDSRDFITKPAIIYFGYSYCPDVCPYDLQRNIIAIDILSENGINIKPIFITIDPLRDTPDRLKEFSTFIHPKLLALTGTQNEINEVMKLFKVYGQKSNENNYDKNNYLMDHSAFTYLVDSSGSLITYFNRKTSAEEMAAQISCYLTK